MSEVLISSYEVIRLFAVIWFCVCVFRMSDLGYFTSLGKELGLEGEELLKFATNSWREQKDMAREERKIAREEKQKEEEREEKRPAREDKLEAEEREERDRKARLEVEEKERERRHELELLTAKNRQELELAKCTQESEEVVSSESGSERSRHVGPELFAQGSELWLWNPVCGFLALAILRATKYEASTAVTFCCWYLLPASSLPFMTPSALYLKYCSSLSKKF